MSKVNKILRFKCEWCGKYFERYESKNKGKTALFCSVQCKHDFQRENRNSGGALKRGQRKK